MDIDPLSPSKTELAASVPGKKAFQSFSSVNLNNGLTDEENSTLAHTPHVDQAVTLILRGLLRVVGAEHKP